MFPQADDSRHASPDWNEDGFAPCNSTSPINSHHGSPKLDETLPSDFIDPPPMPKVPTAPVDTKLQATIRLQSVPQKWKASYQDQIHKTSELEWASWLSIVEIQMQGKTTRQEIKEGKRHKTALDIKHSCVSHACNEMLIWDRKLELAWLQAGVPPQSAEPSQTFTSMMSSFGNGSRIHESSLSTQSSSSSSSSGLRLSPAEVEGGYGWDLPMSGYTGNMGGS